MCFHYVAQMGLKVLVTIKTQRSPLLVLRLLALLPVRITLVPIPNVNVHLANFSDAGISGHQLTLPPSGAPTPELESSKDPLPPDQIKELRARKKAKFRPGPAHTLR